MKKFLLSAAALVCAASVNAQVLQLNAEEFGLGSDAADVAAGTTWGAAGSATFNNPFATQHKAVNCKNNNYNQVLFNGTDLVLTAGGVQGQDNPKDIDGGNPGVTLVAPATGAAVEVVAETDGYVYIVAKLSSNKNYYVFEEGTAVGFTLAMQVNSEAFPSGMIKYTVEGEGEYNEVTDPAKTDWPEKVALGDAYADAIKVNGLGVIGFNVYAGCKYLVGAGGSKISWCGAYFCEGPVSVVLQGTDAENPVPDFTLIGDGPTPGPEPEPTGDVLDINAAYFWATGTKEGNVVTFTKEWDGLAWWLGGEKPGITKIVAEFEEATPMLTQFLVQGDGAADQSAQAPAGSTKLEIEIPADMMVKQVAIQNAEPGVIKVKSVTLYYGTVGINNVKAEASAAVSYNLFGQKANATSGLMIKNGNKVLVK